MKTALVFLASVITAFAQDLAPDSIANHVANYTLSGSGGSAASSNALFTPAQSFRIVNTASPLADAMTYTWTKTGPVTATLVETDGARINTTAVTFTTPLRGTFRTTSNASTAALVGTVAFAAVPQPSPPLINISTRAALSAGQTLTPGFVVGGAVARRVLVRAVGPTLSGFAVPVPMADPSLAVFQGQTQIGANNDWGGGAALTAVFTSVGAFALPVASLDAAIVLTLPPGNYTAQVRGTGAGEVLVEVYFVD